MQKMKSNMQVANWPAILQSRAAVRVPVSQTNNGPMIQMKVVCAQVRFVRVKMRRISSNFLFSVVNKKRAEFAGRSECRMLPGTAIKRGRNE